MNDIQRKVITQIKELSGYDIDWYEDDDYNGEDYIYKASKFSLWLEENGRITNFMCYLVSIESVVREIKKEFRLRNFK